MLKKSKSFNIKALLKYIANKKSRPVSQLFCNSNK